jgi:predicted pyridoxine 5'-phosphate oxidase superfamily flavin-nucleotide-binding protein
MPGSIMFHEGNRRLQDEFDSRKISDRLEEKLTRTRFSDDDKAFVENSIFFFIASADAAGRPDCSFKGGGPGFVRVSAPDELVFPDYDGNGMFKSGQYRVQSTSACCSSISSSPSACASTAPPRCGATIRCCSSVSARN